MNLEHITAILLDLDGTLVETDNKWADKIGARLLFLKRILPALDTALLGRKIVMAVETPANYVVSTLEHLGLGSGLFGLTDRLRKSKGLATKEASTLVPGTIPLLDRLSRRYKLAVVTTRARPEALAFVRSSGTEKYFAAVVTRQDVLRMKPHPEPVQKAAHILATAPSACLMIGDTTMDMRSASRAGAVAVGVLSGFGTEEELWHAGASLVLEQAYDILPHLPLN